MRAMTLALTALTFVSAQAMALTATLKASDWYISAQPADHPVAIPGDPSPGRVVTVGTTLTWRWSDIYNMPSGMDSNCRLNLSAWPRSLTKNGANWIENYAAGLSVNATGVGNGATNTTAASNVAVAVMPGLPAYTIKGFTGTSESTITATFSQPGYYELGFSGGLGIACNSVPAGALEAVGRIFIKVVTAAEAATPESGWYYDPAQSGRGFAIQLNRETGAGYIGLFGYSDDGRADWFVSDCRYDAAARACAGVLRAFNSGPTLNDYTGPTAAVTGIAGNFLVGWPTYDGTAASNRKATMTFGNNTREIIRYPLPGTSESNGSESSDLGKDAGLRTGWYLGEGESGRGYFIETTRIRNAAGVTTGLSLYGVAFMYRADGSPTWYVFSNNVQGTSMPRVLEATPLLEFGGGTPFSNASGIWVTPGNLPTGSPGNIMLSMGTTIMLYLPGQRAKRLNSFLTSIK